MGQKRVRINENHTNSLTWMTWHIRDQACTLTLPCRVVCQCSKYIQARCTVLMDVRNSTETNIWEMFTIRFASWISGRIASLQPDTDIQKEFSNVNQIRTRISETLLLIFRGFRLLEKVVHCTITHLLSSEVSFQLSVSWLRVCLWCKLGTVV